MSLTKAALRAAIVASSLESASFAAEPSHVDVRVDAVAREVDRTLGATLRERQAPALVHEHIAALLGDTREALRRTAPLRAQGPPAQGVTHLGAGLTLDGDTLRGSWRESSLDHWRSERSVRVVDQAITLRTKDGVLDDEIELTPTPFGWRVSTTHRTDSPSGVGQQLGRDTHYLDRRGTRMSSDEVRARRRAVRR